jgi:transcriptional regulator with XRE-family HTH domain
MGGIIRNPPMFYLKKMTATKLRKLRRSSNITQNQLGVALGHKSGNYICLIEKGLRNVSPEFEELIIKAIEQIKQSKTK